MFGFNSKKRPNSLIMGRFFDNQVTDMFEFGMDNFIPMEDFKVNSQYLLLSQFLQTMILNQLRYQNSQPASNQC